MQKVFGWAMFTFGVWAYSHIHSPWLIVVIVASAIVITANEDLF